MSDLEGFDRKTLASSPPVWSHVVTARFQDVDAAGLVFFAHVFGYFHDAYLAFMAQGGMPHRAVLERGDWGAPLRHAEADFIAPIRFGDVLLVGLVKARVRASVLTIGYRVITNVTGHDTVVAVGRTEHAIVTLATMTRREPPSELRAVFARLEDRP